MRKFSVPTPVDMAEVILGKKLTPDERALIDQIVAEEWRAAMTPRPGPFAKIYGTSVTESILDDLGEINDGSDD